MTFDRRSVLTAGIGAGLATGVLSPASVAGPRTRHEQPIAAAAVSRAGELGLEPNASYDQSAALQAAIDAAAARAAPLHLPPGRFLIRGIVLRSGTRLIGARGTTIFEFAGASTFLSATKADNIVLQGIGIDGAYKRLDGSDALVSLQDCGVVSLSELSLARSPANAISMSGCSGTIADCTVTTAMQAGIHSLDARGLDIRHNTVADCANNGIQVWRSTQGEDGTVVAGNRIERIRADSGGTGENGNGVNIFRAGGVIATGNRVTDCAYSAIRGNAASDMQIIANSCARLGEVALYAEFGFQGALIASNLVDTAATGISVTNFNDGGRLAVVQGNLIRNLVRREQEPEDKRGNGIAVEADSVVSANTIEGAPTAGIVIGWGRYVRDVVATGNLVRASKVGILVSTGGGACLLANNMISGATAGAIRAMDASGEPSGPELASGDAKHGRIAVSGNLAV
jgi:uncharacterized secreted repeat protein (TIGR03808 family)